LSLLSAKNGFVRERQFWVWPGGRRGARTRACRNGMVIPDNPLALVHFCACLGASPDARIVRPGSPTIRDISRLGQGDRPRMG
jgi:hypothetical protein